MESENMFKLRKSFAAAIMILCVFPNKGFSQFAPTATEIFELRNKCAVLAEETAKPFRRHVLGDLSLGIEMITPDGTKYIRTKPSTEGEFRETEFTVSVVSNLNIKTLRCFALVTILEINSLNYPHHESYIHLLDAQKGEVLAYRFDAKRYNNTMFGSDVSDPDFVKPNFFYSLDLSDKMKKEEGVNRYIKERMGRCC
jgi:hypothetical protein